MSETTEVNRAAFGQFLNQLRREKGWTQKDLAERLYVSDKAVSKWERGLSLPDVALLLPLAGALGVSVTELLEGRRAVQEQRYSAADVFDPGRGLWRGLWSLCFFLDDRDAAPLL